MSCDSDTGCGQPDRLAADLLQGGRTGRLLAAAADVVAL